MADWTAFANKSDQYYRYYNYSQYEHLRPSHHNLNLLWIKIKELLTVTANQIVSKSYISEGDIISKPKQLVESYAAVKTLNKILL